MSVLSLVLRRAQTQLDAFCQRRNAQAGMVRGGLCCREENENVLILVRERVSHRNPTANDRQVLLRLVLDGSQWQLYWPRSDGVWEAYAQLPCAPDIDRVIDELEQAPLHVHW